jgi:hypothetical protein
LIPSSTAIDVVRWGCGHAVGRSITARLMSTASVYWPRPRLPMVTVAAGVPPGAVLNRAVLAVFRPSANMARYPAPLRPPPRGGHSPSGPEAAVERATVRTPGDLDAPLPAAVGRRPEATRWQCRPGSRRRRRGTGQECSCPFGATLWILEVLAMTDRSECWRSGGGERRHQLSSASHTGVDDLSHASASGMWRSLHVRRRGS